MIKHIVLWKLKDHAEGVARGQNIRRLQALLETLPGLIPEIKTFEVGQTLKPSEEGYDLALYSTFATRQALKRYVEHPGHVKVANFVRAVTAQRAVLDYEI